MQLDLHEVHWSATTKLIRAEVVGIEVDLSSRALRESTWISSALIMGIRIRSVRVASEDIGVRERRLRSFNNQLLVYV